jgi:hypothetical protein
LVCVLYEGDIKIGLAMVEVYLKTEREKKESLQTGIQVWNLWKKRGKEEG